MIDAAAVIAWYGENRRDLPWRSTTPYGVLVSEVMLQQTPVSRVLPIWTSWMHRWPDVRALAAASRGDVLRHWGGLGYPRRAIRLHQAAQIIVSDHQGVIPSEPAILRTLPGIGEYTAAAVAAFAFDQPAIVLDINVRRLLARAALGVNAPTSSISKVERELAARLLPEINGHIWAAASMELGAVMCTARSPKCGQCPLQTDCAWRTAGQPMTVITKGQTWHGTDRQCRGALLKLLRSNDEPVPHSDLESAWSDAEQRERCLAHLVLEGLVEAIEADPPAWRLPL